jgi:hypothetical protein
MLMLGAACALPAAIPRTAIIAQSLNQLVAAIRIEALDS